MFFSSFFRERVGMTSGLNFFGRNLLSTLLKVGVIIDKDKPGHSDLSGCYSFLQTCLGNFSGNHKLFENPVEYRLVGFTSYSVCVSVCLSVCVSTFVTSFFSFSPLSISSPSCLIELHFGLPHCSQRSMKYGDSEMISARW